MSASCDVLVFQTTHRCHSVFSCLAPLASFQERLVASENVATRLPPVVERTSGSFPRFPIKLTLFRLRLTVPPGERIVPRRARCHPTGFFAQAFRCRPFHFARSLAASASRLHAPQSRADHCLTSTARLPRRR